MSGFVAGDITLEAKVTFLRWSFPFAANVTIS